MPGTAGRTNRLIANCLNGKPPDTRGFMMREDSKRLFDFGTLLARLTAESIRLEPTHVTQLKLSDYHVRIAKDLMASTYVRNQMEVPAWGDLPSGVQQRYLEMSERAIMTAGTEVRQRLIDRTVAYITDWMNAPYGGLGTAPAPEEIAREAVTYYECSLSNVPLEVL